MPDLEHGGSQISSSDSTSFSHLIQDLARKHGFFRVDRVTSSDCWRHVEHSDATSCAVFRKLCGKRALGRLF